MENQSIIIKRTKDELRRYNVFSTIERRPLRKAMEYIGPITGLIFIILFLLFSNIVFLVIGLFFALYPLMLRRMIMKFSDLSYDSNSLSRFEIDIAFNETGFSTSSGDLTKDIQYDDLFLIYIREKDMIIYITKFSGLYINKDSYSEEVISNIVSLIKNAVPDKIKTFK